MLVLATGMGLLAGGVARAAPSAAGTHVWRPRIALVWPHDEAGNPAPVERATLVNVSVWPTSSIPCFIPADSLRLFLAAGNGPTEVVEQIPTLALREREGRFFPTLEYNDIPVQRNEQGQVDMRFYAQQYASYTNVWVHGTDGRTNRPEPFVVSRPESPRSLPPSFFIQGAFPHDEQGVPQPVEQATRVNLTAEVIATDERGTWQPVAGFAPFEAPGAGPFIQVLAAAANQPLNSRSGIRPESSVASRIASVATLASGAPVAAFYEVEVQHFNDIPVEPGQPTHFLIDSGKLGFPSTIWSHATDARTLLPVPETPPQCLGYFSQP